MKALFLLLLCIACLACESAYTPRWQRGSLSEPSGDEAAVEPISAQSELLRRWSEGVDETLWSCLVAPRYSVGGPCGLGAADCEVMRRRGEQCRSTRTVTCHVYKNPGVGTGYPCWDTRQACEENEALHRREEHAVLLGCTDIRLWGTRQPFTARLASASPPTAAGLPRASASWSCAYSRGRVICERSRGACELRAGAGAACQTATRAACLLARRGDARDHFCFGDMATCEAEALDERNAGRLERECREE